MSTDKTSPFEVSTIGKDELESIFDSLLSSEDHPNLFEILSDTLIEKYGERFGNDKVWHLLAHMIDSSINLHYIEVDLKFDHGEDNEAPLFVHQTYVDPIDGEALFSFKDKKTNQTYCLSLTRTKRHN